MFSPNHYYHGVVNHIVKFNMLDVTIDLTLGVLTRRSVLMNGFSTDGIDNDRAIHCLVTLVGGRHIFIHADDANRDGHVRGDVFTDAWSPPIPVAQCIQIPCCNNPVVVIASWMRWAASINYDASALRKALKG